jgi:hypothetical protein
MGNIEDFKPRGLKITKEEKELLISNGYSFCAKCNKVHLISEFNKDKSNRYGFSSTCKTVERLKAAQNRFDNPEETRRIRRESRDRHIENSRLSKKKWDSNNKENILLYKRNRYKSDPIYKMQIACRCMVKRMFKSTQIKKCYKTSEILGYTTKDLKEHLEKQFTDGMSWDNYGKWHIDHVKPISLATTLGEGIVLSQLDNLQPLWGIDNLIKGNKYKPMEMV